MRKTVTDMPRWNGISEAKSFSVGPIVAGLRKVVNNGGDRTALAAALGPKPGMAESKSTQFAFSISILKIDHDSIDCLPTG